MEDTPIEVTTKYIDGIVWPASKQDVLSTMERNGAPEDVLQALRSVEREDFTGPNEVHNVLWKVA